MIRFGLVSEVLKKNIAYRFCKAFLLAASIFFPSVGLSCICESEGFESLYRRAEGVYFVAISGMNVVEDRHDDVAINLELKVLKVFKGSKKDTLHAKGFASFPFFDENGNIGESSTSCSVSYSFAEYYIFLEFSDVENSITRCSSNILNREYWKKLDW